jgi:branched-chain amino acid transport system permease protein
MEVSGILISAFSGLFIGCLYALMAMGLSVIWTTLRFVNFAHGAILTWGAYVMWFVISSTGVGYAPAFVLTVAIVALTCVAIEKAVFRPLRYGAWPAVATMISTLALAIAIQQVCLILFGGRIKQVPALLSGFVRYGSLSVDLNLLSISIVALASLTAVYLYLKTTKIGLAIRAVAQDIAAANLMGVNVDRVYAYTMALGGAMAAATGILLGSVLYITPDMGLDPLEKAFIICVFGGITSIRGTIIAALTVGVVEAVAQYMLPPFWSLPVLFLMMMAILVLKPSGLFGVEEELGAR